MDWRFTTADARIKLKSLYPYCNTDGLLGVLRGRVVELKGFHDARQVSLGCISGEVRPPEDFLSVELEAAAVGLSRTVRLLRGWL